jgi:alpha/beta superfamily hydrolase
MEIKKIFIKNKEIYLEAEVFKPHFDDHKAVLLIVHPHPNYGGDMYNNVVSTIFNKFIANGISTLRFNFRGVGLSTGSHSDGNGEISDVKACIDFLLLECEYNEVLICGYSYGAAIGSSAINYSENVVGYCAISFPWDFMGLKYKELSQTKKPKLFIQGDYDNIAIYDNFDAHFKFYLDPKKSKVINGADHFYWGFENLVADEVYDFFLSLFK